MRRTILFLLTLCALAPALAPAAGPADPLTGEAEIYRVIDGDTYILNAGSDAAFTELAQAARRAGADEHLQPRYRGFRVRLFGVDTAESVHPDAARNTAEGKAVSRAVAERLEGERVTYRCFDFGYYERAICTLNHRGEDVGEWLIRSGYSDYITEYGRHPFDHDGYRAAERAQ